MFIVHFSSNQSFLLLLTIVALLLVTSLLLLSHLVGAPCYTRCRAFLFSHHTLLLAPYCFRSRALLFSLLCCSHLAAYIALLLLPCSFHSLATHDLLPYHRALLFCLTGSWALLPCHCALLLCRATHHYLLAFFKYLLRPPLLIHCLATLGILSPLSCASGGTWRNTNKLHPTTKVFFSRFLEFLFLCFVFCLFVIFFELNTFCFSVVCEF